MTPLLPMSILTFVGLFCSVSAHATACMVMGERTAVVRSSEGERSPVFLAPSCESLRLVSGKAMVSWVTRDGKPRMLNLGALGVDGLPKGGADDAAASAVWSELTSKRDVHRAAYTRSLAVPAPQRLYIPPEGLVFAAKAGDTLRLTLHKDGKETVVQEQTAAQGEVLQVTRSMVQPGLAFALVLTQDGASAFYALKRIPLAEQKRLDALYPQFPAEMTDLGARALVLAMWYEQVKLSFNRQAVLPAAKVGVHADKLSAETQ